MAAKTDSRKRQRRHSFSSLEQVAKEMELKSQQQTTEYNSIAGVKRPHSPDVGVGGGVSPKKPALSNDRESSDFLYLPAGKFATKDLRRCGSFVIYMHEYIY